MTTLELLDGPGAVISSGDQLEAVVRLENLPAAEVTAADGPNVIIETYDEPAGEAS